MKKIFAIFAIAVTVVACGNKGDKKADAAKDSVNVLVDSAENRINNAADSASKMMNNAADSARKMINKAVDSVKPKM